MGSLQGLVRAKDPDGGARKDFCQFRGGGAAELAGSGAGLENRRGRFPEIGEVLQQSRRGGERQLDNATLYDRPSEGRADSIEQPQNFRI